MANSENKADPGAASLQREVQQRQDQIDQQGPRASVAKSKKAVQTTEHDYPGTPLPAQHLDKPGLEADLQQKPEFLAPDYAGSSKLARIAMTAMSTSSSMSVNARHCCWTFVGRGVFMDSPPYLGLYHTQSAVGSASQGSRFTAAVKSWAFA